MGNCVQIKNGNKPNSRSSAQVLKDDLLNLLKEYRILGQIDLKVKECDSLLESIKTTKIQWKQAMMSTQAFFQQFIKAESERLIKEEFDLIDIYQKSIQSLLQKIESMNELVTRLEKDSTVDFNQIEKQKNKFELERLKFLKSYDQVQQAKNSVKVSTSQIEINLKGKIFKAIQKQGSQFEQTQNIQQLSSPSANCNSFASQKYNSQQRIYSNYIRIKWNSSKQQVLNLNDQSYREQDINNFRPVYNDWTSSIQTGNNQIVLAGGQNQEHQNRIVKVTDLQAKTFDSIYPKQFPSLAFDNNKHVYIINGKYSINQISNKCLCFDIENNKAKGIKDHIMEVVDCGTASTVDQVFTFGGSSANDQTDRICFYSEQKQN